MRRLSVEKVMITLAMSLALVGCNSSPDSTPSTPLTQAQPLRQPSALDESTPFSPSDVNGQWTLVTIAYETDARSNSASLSGEPLEFQRKLRRLNLRSGLSMNRVEINPTQVTIGTEGGQITSALTWNGHVLNLLNPVQQFSVEFINGQMQLSINLASFYQRTAIPAHHTLKLTYDRVESPSEEREEDENLDLESLFNGTFDHPTE